MNTKKLGRTLGAVDIVHVQKTVKNKQLFNYLLVLDFEATCWDQSDKNKGPPEIIEFPVVLYSVQKDKIVDEFRRYVTPKERPQLSDFCKSLTGIQQGQVDHGVPLQNCLLLFVKWICEKMKVYDMDFPYHSGKAKNRCAFVTWSDWDLGTCLKNECHRKGLVYHDMFQKWIDIRALFKVYYKKSFSGLSGALEEVGLQFKGSQHCGLDDARNTARLAGKMIADGVILRLTK